MTDTNPFLAFTDADLKVALQRALKTILVLGVMLFLILTLADGWQTGLLLVAGAVISASGVYEAKQLIAAVNDRLDNAKNPTPMGRVMTMFFLRLLLAGAILYGSLKCFHGSIYAVVAGLCLGVVSLSIEAVRFVRT